MPIPLDPAQSADRAKGLLAPLFDFSFAAYITPRLIKVLYLLGFVGGLVLAVAAIAAAFNANSYFGILALFCSPLVFLLTLACTRVALELVAVVFRVEEHLRRLP